MTYPALDSVLVQTNLASLRRARRRFWKERIQHALYLVGLVMAVAVFFKAAWVLELVKGWM